MKKIFDITISKLDLKHDIGPNWNGWNVKVQCQLHKDTFTDVVISPAGGAIEDISRALQHVSYAEHLLKDRINYDDNTVEATFDIDVSQEQIKADLLELGIPGENIPDGTIVANTRQEQVEPEAEPEIFVFQAVDPLDPVQDKDVFSNVATLYDMLTIPAGEPVTLDDQPPGYENIPYYRMDTVELLFLNTQDADNFIRTTLHCARGLAAEYRALGKYTSETTQQV